MKSIKVRSAVDPTLTPFAIKQRFIALSNHLKIVLKFAFISAIYRLKNDCNYTEMYIIGNHRIIIVFVH